MSMSYEDSSPGENLVFDLGSPATHEEPTVELPDGNTTTAQDAEPEEYVPSYRGELDDQPAAVTSFEDIFGSSDNGYSSSLPSLDTAQEQSKPVTVESVTEDTTTEDPDEIFGDLTPEQIDSMSSDELLAHYTGEPIDSDDGIPGGLDEYESWGQQVTLWIRSRRKLSLFLVFQKSSLLSPLVRCLCARLRSLLS